MTFRTQANDFLKRIENRKRKPLKKATVLKYQACLNNHVLPTLGDMELAEVDNAVLKGLLNSLSGSVSDRGLVLVSVIVKAVIASAVDAGGNPLYPRTWNDEFIDVPVVDPSSRKAPTATPEGIQEAISRGFKQDKALYALLAGTGLRIGEALALMVGPDDGINSFWNPESGTIVIRTTVVKNQIQNVPKTMAGKREIDLHPDLNAYLKSTLNPGVGLVFQAQNHGLVRWTSIYEHLNKTEIQGFHSLRRFRITHLRQNAVPESLIKFWVGHTRFGEDTTDRYDQTSEDIKLRKQYAAQAGLGFQLGVA